MSRKSSKSELFFMDTDNDSHWYVIPLKNASEWQEWLDIDSDDERAWAVPDFAIPVGGHASLIHFSNWEHSD